jgi:hypothetical protein
VVLHGCVPEDYTDQKLHSMMTAIAATALRVQRLHDEVWSPLVDVLSNPPDPPNGASSSDCQV